MKADLIERYAVNLHGVLSCFDRILITGTLPGACYALGLTGFLNAHGVRIFDYARFAEPLRERIRERAQEVCAAAGIGIEHNSRLCRDKVSKARKFRDDKESLCHQRIALIGSGSGNAVVLHLTFPEHMHCLNA